MANHGHDALWAKLYELELQLAAYKLQRAARGEEDVGARADGAWGKPAGATCRGRQYDAYMRRRDARRMGVAAAALAEPPAKGQGQQPRPRGTRAGGGRTSPLTLKCAAARDAQEVKRTSAASIPTTPRKETGALSTSRTVSTGTAAAGGTPAKPHQRRNSVAGVTSDFGEGATPWPFLRRGSGTGGAAVARLRTPRVHDLPLSDVSSSRPRPPPQDHSTRVARRHSRSVSELPFHTPAAMDSPRSATELLPTQAWARKRWGSPERPPPAMFSAAAAATDSHKDFAKGLRKLLSFVRKSSKSTEHQHCPARSVVGGERDSGGKPVKGRASAAVCSLLDGPFDRASLEGHQFPMTQAVGISG